MTGAQSNGVSTAKSQADPITLDSSSSYSDFLDKHDAFLLDCDGVIWNGDEPIEGVVETLNHLRKIGKKLVRRNEGRRSEGEVLSRSAFDRSL